MPTFRQCTVRELIDLVPAFKNLDKRTKDALATACHKIQEPIKAGQEVSSPHEPMERAYVIIYGLIRLVYPDQKLHTYRSNGQLTGDVALITGRRSKYRSE